MSHLTEQFDYEIRDGAARLTGFHGDGKKIAIPEQIGGVPVRVVGARSFYDDGMYIEEIRVPSSVRVIEPYAFELCVSLKRLILAEGVEEIGAGATLATELEVLPIPASVRKIEGIREMTCALQIDPKNPYFQADGYALYQDGILIAVNPSDPRSSYAVRAGTRGIAAGAFDNQPKLQRIHLPASLTEAPEGVFANVREPFAIETGIREITVDPDNPVFFMREGALYRRLQRACCALVRCCGAEDEDRYATGRDAHFPARQTEKRTATCFDPGEEVIRIEEAACLRSGLRRVKIPASVSSIGADAFALCPLEEAVLMEEVRIYFPQSDSFLLKNLLQGFGQNGQLYDFTEYDRTLLETHLNPDRVRMILSRVDILERGKPSGMEQEQGRKRNDSPGMRVAALLREITAERITEIVLFCAEKGDIDLLAALGAHGFYTGENIGHLIESVNETDHREACAWLMNLQNQSFRADAFDFSL